LDELEKLALAKCPNCQTPTPQDPHHYKNMQKQFLDRPMQAAGNLLQVEVGKPQKSYKQSYYTEKRSATNKKRGGTMAGFNLSALNTSTPEK